jgi:hypothetical protein
VPESGAVAADLDATKLIMAMANVNGVSKLTREYVIASAAADAVDEVLETPIFKSITPSRLDRLRMDRIAARPVLARELAATLGDDFIHLRGQGGTGKTVLLLQTAYEAFQEKGSRSLILTYNHALAADIQRLLALMKIPSSNQAGGVDVRTVMSFTSAWLEKLGVTNDDGDFLLHYNKYCATAINYLQEGLITSADLQTIISNNPDQFDYDALLIDEAQDLPQSEKDLLTQIYNQSSIVIADGMSQLVRGRPTNWKNGQNRVQPHNFKECLRMKASLGRFANEAAKLADINWRIKPNTQAAGGRIIVLKRPYANYPDLRKELAAKALAEGNAPIDFLHCVPPSSVKTEGNRQVSELGELLGADGLEVWDGVDEMTRQDYPRSPQSHRIVQYQSCRGLEGWLVVLDGLDQFWSLKYAESYRAYDQLEPSQKMIDRDVYAKSRAWEWIMIALTRPIDTLVISLQDLSTYPAEALLRLSRLRPDMIDVID